MRFSKIFPSSIYNLKALTRRKPKSSCILEAESESSNSTDSSQQTEKAKETMSLLDLLVYGISATVGSGVYLSLGEVAKDVGPSIVLSTSLAGFSSLLTAFCYLEFASRLPTSGSSYLYSYATLGELIGWIVGWNMTLEYAFSASSIAVGWSDVLSSLVGENFPRWLTNATDSEGFFRINLLAFLLILIISLVVCAGIKFSAMFNNVITTLNISVLLFTIIAGLKLSSPENWSSQFVGSSHGSSAIVRGAIEMFFSYLGFDTICTLTADAKNPGRDIPIAVLGTIGTATIIYIGIGLALTGMIKFSDISKESPLVEAFRKKGFHVGAEIVGIGCLFAMTATMLSCLMGQPKVFQAMAKDGLLPAIFTRVDKKGNAKSGIYLTAVIAGLGALFLNRKSLLDLVTFGCVFGFTIVSGGLLYLRGSSSSGSKDEKTSTMAVTAQKCNMLAIAGLVLSSIPLGIFLRKGYLMSALTVFILPVCTIIGYLVYLYGWGYPEVFYPGTLACPFRRKNTSSLEVSITGDGKEKIFACPLVPIIPALAICINVILLFQISDNVFWQFPVWTIMGLIFYFFYGIKHSVLRKPMMPENEVVMGDLKKSYADIIKSGTDINSSNSNSNSNSTVTSSDEHGVIVVEEEDFYDVQPVQK